MNLGAATITARNAVLLVLLEFQPQLVVHDAGRDFPAGTVGCISFWPCVNSAASNVMVSSCQTPLFVLLRTALVAIGRRA